MNNDKDKIRQQIYLGALLHDIGKFYQRFDPNSTSQSKLLSANIKNLESIYCPTYNNYYTHKHVLWTAQFFDNHREKINKIFELPKNDDRLMTLAAGHHRPSQDNDLSIIIQLADKLSSVAEREEKKQEHLDDEKGWDGFKKVPLKSIFDIISLNGNYPDSAVNPLRSQVLTIEKLPNADDINYKPDYSIWEKFEEEFAKISDKLSPENFIQTLDALLHKYTYCIPSSTVDEPDISLYDHSKTTSFLAISLYDYLQSTQMGVKEINDDAKPFVLLGGDISGIQDFIYDIPNKGAAKQLKGRSFYIHLLTETIVRYILREFNLLHLNVVYSSGGNFYLLLPNLKNIDKKINDLKTTINEKLLNKFGTDIYLAMEYEAISIANLKQKEPNKEVKLLSEIWDNLISEKIYKAKNQRYLTILNENYDKFFKPDIVFNVNNFDEEINNLGRILKKTKFLVFSDYKIKNKQSIINIDLGVNAYLYEQEPTNIENVEIIKFNDTQFIFDKESNNTYRFEFYGGNDFPSDEQGDPKTFEELAQGKDFDRLGIVRMDVDNLGKIFAEGFHPRLRTFSRLTSLSRNLDFFFKGYLNTIWHSTEDFKENTYILYSGGDDLFLIGRWDKTIEFAYEVKKAFSEFTKSTEFGLSGGVSIEKPKYPIRRAAFNAGNVEKKAKAFSIENSKINNQYSKPLTKNAFTLFGTALSWQSDFEKVLEIKNHLIDYDKKDNLSKSLINSIKMFYYLKDFQEKKEKIQSWRWTMAYYLQRTKERLSKKDEDLKNYIEDLKISIFTDTYNIKTKNEHLNSNYSFLQLLSIAARWAELEIRTK